MTKPTRIGPLDARQALFKRLDRSLGSRLTLITAPEHSGKSVLLQDWIDSVDSPIAMLSFNKCEYSDPLNFAANVIDSVRHLLPDSFEAPAPDEVNCETLCVTLINSMATSPDDLVLVIDGYQPSPSNDAIIGFILEYLPPHLHLIISTDTTLSIPSLPRMRVRRQLNEITERDLIAFEDEAYPLCG